MKHQIAAALLMLSSSSAWAVEVHIDPNDVKALTGRGLPCAKQMSRDLNILVNGELGLEDDVSLESMSLSQEDEYGAKMDTYIVALAIGEAGYGLSATEVFHVAFRKSDCGIPAKDGYRRVKSISR